MQKRTQFAIHGVIALKSGTRIGGSDDVLQIGGTELTCIKDPMTGRPYIPGSSLKGKMRSELEKCLGKASGPKLNEPCNCILQSCPVCRVFGPHKNTKHSLGPTRIRVYDAPLLSDDFKIELKTESTNLRTTGGADNPRTLERVAPGARFRLRIDIDEYDLDKDFPYENAEGEEVKGGPALLAVVDHCLDMLEKKGIGAGTGKGYGEISIEDLRLEELKRKRLIPATEEA